jgi:hypothetical protein
MKRFSILIAACAMFSCTEKQESFDMIDYDKLEGAKFESVEGSGFKAHVYNGQTIVYYNNTEQKFSEASMKNAFYKSGLQVYIRTVNLPNYFWGKTEFTKIKQI